jgi:hypothetical protein
MKTLQELIEDTRSYSAKRISNLPQIEFNDLQKTHELRDGIEVTVIRGSAASERNPDEVYEVQIEAVGQDIDVDLTPVQVRCTCSDFYWRFAAHNHKYGCLCGPEPEPYEKKTDRKPVNPDEIPGLCKHLLNVVAILQEQE